MQSLAYDFRCRVRRSHSSCWGVLESAYWISGPRRKGVFWPHLALTWSGLEPAFGGSCWFGYFLGMGHVHFGGPMVLDVRFLTMKVHPHLTLFLPNLFFHVFLTVVVFLVFYTVFIFCMLFLIVCVSVQFSYCTFPVITLLSSWSLAPACVISAEWGWVFLRRFCSETV